MEGIHDMGVPDKGQDKAEKSAGEKIAGRRVAIPKYVPTDTVKPYFRNPKMHDDQQVRDLADQIAAHGFDQAIVTDAKMVIIKGHGRHMAARLLKMPTIPVVVRTDMSADEVAAARIADNKLAETGWEYGALSDEMRALIEHGFNMKLTGFSDKEIEKMLKEANANVKGATEIPEGDLGLAHTCPKCGFEFND